MNRQYARTPERSGLRATLYGAHRRHPHPGSAAGFRRSRRPRQRFAARVILFLGPAVIVTVLLVLTITSRPVDRHGSSSAPLSVDRRGSSSDPFSGHQLFVDPGSPAARDAASLKHSDPVAAALLRKIAGHPAGTWLGGWIPATRVAAVVQTVMRQAATRRSMPLLVLYAFPYQGCGTDAAGGLAGAAAYLRWIGQVVAGIGAGHAAVILEPDALAEYVPLDCLSPAERQYRLTVIRQAVGQLVRSPKTAVYIDAGNTRWRSAKVMASLLLAVGVSEARGFSLNVSNFDSTAAEESYGDQISALLHGAHYVIDTSRNGAATAKTWCNPPGQALGVPPTASTGNPLVDALLWIKLPGTSDGPCNGGPPAGIFWLSYALRLAANARW
jgi:endoglucanase